MSEAGRPEWAIRLQSERNLRGWGKWETARRLFARSGIAQPGTNQVKALARQISRWEAGEHCPTDWAATIADLFDTTPEELFPSPPEHPPKELAKDAVRPDERLGVDGVSAAIVPEQRPTAAEDVRRLAAWLEETNIGESALDHLERSIRRLAHDYPRQPPLAVLQEAHALQGRVLKILRGGRQRLAQTRSLLSVAAELFALINLLVGDVGRYRIADAYGYAAWTCAQEADSDAARALVRCAQSKTARWEGRHADAAELARRGFELARDGRGHMLLAVSEAIALQGCGDIVGAQAAMRQAQHAFDACAIADAWSCTRARHATYALQADLGAHDPAGTLRWAAEADDAWADGDQWVYGTWAQVRIGAALAHVMAGEPSSAAKELADVFELGAEYRVVTIVGRMSELARRLGHNRYKGDSCATELRERIHAFQAGSLEHKALSVLEVS